MTAAIRNQDFGICTKKDLDWTGGTVTKTGAFLALKCGLLLLLVILTNQGLEDRLRILVSDQRLLSLAVFSLIWMISVAALLVVAFLPGLVVRLAWAIPLGIASAAGYAYYAVQGAEFYIFDMLNFWVSRHEAARATEYYADAAWSATAIFLLCLVAIAMPPSMPAARNTLRSRYWSPLVPLLPVLLIASVVVLRDGKGSQALPMQFSPLSLAAVAAYKINSGSFRERELVSMTPGTPLSRAIVLVVDESIRADFMNLDPDNPTAPEMAALGDRWVDFGPAVASGNCSYLSNAMLRFMVDRRDLVRSVHTSPTIWHYAKAAGYRTVYIDAQPTFEQVYGKLQNLMTPAEVLLIDDFHKIVGEYAPYELDDELVELLLKELSAGDPVFIYANKNGAHFPYAHGSPEPSRPNTKDALADPFLAEIDHYARAVRWSTDRTLARLVREADWNGTTVVYTADHGQNFTPSRLTHCTTAMNVDPSEAIVPLLVASGDAGLQQRFKQVAARHPGHATHFAIPPTLLELMGYPTEEIAQKYEGSLLGDLSWKPQFVSDDILGLFSELPNWHSVDPMQQSRYRTPADFATACGKDGACGGLIMHE